MSERLAVVVPFYNEPEIDRTLDGLFTQAYRRDVNHYLVDNGSTDNTREVIERFHKEHEGFPLRVIEEDQKGTGAAADTGFTAAIQDGYTWIARTDADSLPNPYWTAAIVNSFALNPDVRLVSGRTTALQDRDYRTGDRLLLPASISAARLALSIRHLDLDYLSVVNGANMATSAETYVEVGGFERSTIDEIDEDIEYSLAVIKRFGKSTVHRDPSAIVATSMRRIREYGLFGTAIHHLFPVTRKSRSVDVR